MVNSDLLPGLPRQRTAMLLALLCLVATLTSALRAQPAAREVLTFEQHVRPILKAHCFDCHGEGEVLKGGLDLRLTRSLLAGGDSGPAITPNNPKTSRLLELIESGEMPKRDRKLAAYEIDVIRRWIATGAKTARPEPTKIAPGMQITDEERAHWAFQPIRSHATPRLDPTLIASTRNPIDAFLLSAFPTNGLTVSPEATRLTLIRRASLDLTGLPPSPEDIEAFIYDSRPDAYERLIDRLLQSPHYGERWARHWLDIAGYADSDGYTNDDTPRPYSYKYRDYIIQALNQDIPVQQFLAEQIAGDELAAEQFSSWENAAQDPKGQQLLVATGFLRNAADGTATGGIDQDAARNQVVADTLKILSTSLLGLSVGCAQCHDHRYDPIPHTDYYRLRAFFEPAYNWKDWRTPNQRLVSLATPADRQRSADIEAQAAQLAKDRESRQKQYLDEALKKHLEKFDPALRDPLWTAYQTPAEKRTDAQKKLLSDHPSANIHPGVLYQYNPKAADDLKSIDARIAEIRSQKPVEDFVSVLRDLRPEAPPTVRFHRGDPKQPREPVLPGGLSVLLREGQTNHIESPPPPTHATRIPTTRRRLALAQWLTDSKNPLVPRVIVNRIWMHHFGRGLVGTPSDFGLQGERPSHPALLDWLAAAFVADPNSAPQQSLALGGSFKKLHRLILLSSAYRLSSFRDPDRDALDPDNRHYWRQSVVRLDGESLRDSFLAVSGKLSRRQFGKPVPVREDLVGQIVVGVDRKQGDNKMPVAVSIGEDEFRRSVYIEMRRSRPLAFLNTFDAPVMEVNCERRTSSTVAPQSLLLMNSDVALQFASEFARRVQHEVGDEPEPQVHRAWRLAYGRAPTQIELARALQFLKDQAVLAPQHTPTSPPAKPNDPPVPAPREFALRCLCQNLLSSNEFLYVD